MRFLFLITFWIIACTTAAFSQSSQQMQQNTLRKFIMGKSNPLSLINPLNNGKLNVPFSTKNLSFYNPKDKELRIGRPADENLMVDKGMPIFKPEGSFPMPVYKPDTTIRFTLQIKEYHRIPPVDFR